MWVESEGNFEVTTLMVADRHLRLEIPPEPPANVAGSSRRSRATMEWTLVASIDVAGARDVTATRAVNVVAVPQSGKADSSPGGKLTPEQRRENARKAAKAR